MTFRVAECMIVLVILPVFMFTCGCVTTTIGDAVYSGGDISLSFSHDGNPSSGYVQVTVYQIRNNLQDEKETLYAPLILQHGGNIAHVNATLEPGQYKLYIYLIQDGERKAAAIRDITVN